MKLGRVLALSALTAVLGAAPLAPGALAQTTSPDLVVRPIIPQLLSVRSSTDPITFDLSAKNYPPEQFPARYLSAPQTVAFYSSIPGNWSVQLEVHDVLSAQGTAVVPASQVYFRVNGGDWVEATGGPQVILAQQGPTKDWLPLKLEFALELRGGELGGDFAAEAVFTALALP